MTKTSAFPSIATGTLVALLLSGCAGLPGKQPVDNALPKMGLTENSPHVKEGCACCDAKMKTMSSDMKSMGNIQDKTTPTQGAMCVVDSNSSAKSGCACCGMAEGRCSCCAMGKK